MEGSRPILMGLDSSVTGCMPPFFLSKLQHVTYFGFWTFDWTHTEQSTELYYI